MYGRHHYKNWLQIIMAPSALPVSPHLQNVCMHESKFLINIRSRVTKGSLGSFFMTQSRSLKFSENHNVSTELLLGDWVLGVVCFHLHTLRYPKHINTSDLYHSI